MSLIPTLFLLRFLEWPINWSKYHVASMYHQFPMFSSLNWIIDYNMKREKGIGFAMGMKNSQADPIYIKRMNKQNLYPGSSSPCFLVLYFYILWIRRLREGLLGLPLMRRRPDGATPLGPCGSGSLQPCGSWDHRHIRQALLSMWNGSGEGLRKEIEVSELHEWEGIGILPLLAIASLSRSIDRERERGEFMSANCMENGRGKSGSCRGGSEFSKNFIIL